METRKISIYDLKPAEYNPRIMPTDEMAKLTTSLRTFGLVDPIIIDLTDNNTIIGGHQRYEALIHLDEEELTLIPLGDIGLVINETNIRIKDKNDQKALNLALNKIRGGWDWNKVDEILLDLNSDGYQIDLTGFDEEDINLYDVNIEDEINNELDKGVSEWDKKQNTREEEVKQFNKNVSITRIYYEPGDTIYLGNHKLILGEYDYIPYQINLQDEIRVTVPAKDKLKLIEDNQDIINRHKQEEQKHARMRREII